MRTTRNPGVLAVSVGVALAVIFALLGATGAFDGRTGRELWKGRLPAGGQATPMTYVYRGRQYVVIAAGGHAKSGTKRGDQVVAFALPAPSGR